MQQSESSLETVDNYNEEQRLTYLIQQTLNHNEVWLLTDEHGCVMLNTEDEDCVPIWPSKALAQAWATGEWQHCQAQAISLKDWQNKWTPGLIDDDLAIVACPNSQEQGIILDPEELDDMLVKAANKRKRKQ